MWALRLLVLVGIALLCRLAHSGNPAFAFALAWVPNYVFLGAAMMGVLRLPRILEPVHRMEPVLYRWLGVGLIKWLVTTRAWLMLVGWQLPGGAASRHSVLERIELMSKGAEVCHGASFVFASSIAVLCLAFGSTVTGVWILAFNVVLNAYPIMLQRSIRWRVRQARYRAGERGSC